MRITKPIVALFFITTSIACGGDDDASPDAGADPDGGQVVPTYREIPCADVIADVAVGLKCGYVKVPQNRVRNVGGSVELFLIQSQTPPTVQGPPLIVLAGGPGAPHGAFAGRKDLPNRMSALLERDVIYVEQRGVGLSLPSTECLGLGSEPTAFATCRVRWEQNGIDIDSFNTIENAADLAAIPTALGIEKIDVFAGSYATRLTSQLLGRHPEVVRVAILGGVTTPRPWSEVPDDIAAFGPVLEAINEDFAARCGADSACSAFLPGWDLDTIGQNLGALIERDGGVEILGATISTPAQLIQMMFPLSYLSQPRNMMLAALYHASTETTPTFYAHIGEGDAAVGAEFVARLLSEAQAQVYSPPTGMSRMVRCYDDEPCPELSDLQNDYPRSEFTTTPGTAVPVHLFTGTLDPATPKEEAAKYLPKLTNGSQSLFTCLGHDVSRISNLANGTCLVEQAKAFLADPNATLPSCEVSHCAGMPLIPDQSDLTGLLREYVESF